MTVLLWIIIVTAVALAITNIWLALLALKRSRRINAMLDRLEARRRRPN